MSKLGTTTTRLTLPSNTDEEPSWVDLKTALYPLDVIDLDITEDSDEYKVFCTLSERVIIGWSYTDQDGQPVPAEIEWIDKLSNDDKRALSEYVGALFLKSFKGVSSEEKKVSSAPLTETPELEQSAPPII